MAAEVEFWSGVGVDIETAKATALVVTAISKANPGVATYTGTDPIEGSYVLIKAAGMEDVDDRVFRVGTVNGAGNTFELDGEDTTDYDTFTSGTAEVITFGASMTNAQDIDASGGDPELQDITTIHGKRRKQAPTVLSALSLKFGTLFNPADPAIVEMAKATRRKETRCARLRFSGGTIMVFNCFPAASNAPTGTAQGPVKSPVSMEVQGSPTIYAD